MSGNCFQWNGDCVQVNVTVKSNGWDGTTESDQYSKGYDNLMIAIEQDKLNERLIRDLEKFVDGTTDLSVKAGELGLGDTNAYKERVEWVNKVAKTLSELSDLLGEVGDDAD